MTAARAVRCLASAAAVAAIHPAVAPAQGATAQPRDSVRLGALVRVALQLDPRQRELALLAEQSRLRQSNLTAERLPEIAGEGRAQYQSDVARVPVRLPGGIAIPSPAHDSYDAYISAQQAIFDPTLGPRRAIERRTLAGSQARVRTTLFSVRREVEEAFFAVAALQARIVEIHAAVADLDARRREAVQRVRAGVSLPSDSAALEAAMLQRTQDESTLRAELRATTARLGALTGTVVPDDAVLVLPELGALADAMRDSVARLRARPEYEAFSSTRALLASREHALAAGELPRLSAFARLGYGRPGLNPLGNRFDSYWLAGIQLRWHPFTWGTVHREREVLDLQRRIVSADEQAFRAGIERATRSDVAAMDRLAGALVIDDRLVALREAVERESRARLREGAITAAEYVDRSAELLAARAARASHRVELARAQARFLTTLGVALPEEAR